jgi:hypothetical protein
MGKDRYYVAMEKIVKRAENGFTLAWNTRR